MRLAMSRALSGAVAVQKLARPEEISVGRRRVRGQDIKMDDLFNCLGDGLDAGQARSAICACIVALSANSPCSVARACSATQKTRAKGEAGQADYSEGRAQKGQETN